MGNDITLSLDCVLGTKGQMVIPVNLVMIFLDHMK
jgi:hypothetical protein